MALLCLADAVGLVIAGISSETTLRPASITEEELLELVSKLSNDVAVDGLLVQLPLPGEQLSSTPAFQEAPNGCRMGDPALILPLSTSCLQGFSLWSLNLFLCGSISFLSWVWPRGCLKIPSVSAGLRLQSASSALCWQPGAGSAGELQAPNSEGAPGSELQLEAQGQSSSLGLQFQLGAQA